MSKWTKEEVSEVERILRKHSNGPGTFDYEAADMLREYAATLEQQAEWPSDDECRAVRAKMPLSAAHTPIEMMRAALQSVRPPASRHARQVPDGWAAAYAAFRGAFDTPLSHRKDDSEYAWDARRRLRDFNDAMLSTAPPPAAGVPDGTWLWGKLMDWCKSRGYAPASMDDLFAIVDEAHKLSANPSPAIDVAAVNFHGFQIVENANVPDGEIWVYDKTKLRGIGDAK